MKYAITELDKTLLLNSTIQYKFKISVTNSNRQVIDIIYGIPQFGGVSVNSDSDIRRTSSFVLKLEDFINNIEKKITSWLGLFYEIEVGVFNPRTNDFIWYPQGRYKITAASTSYNATNNTLAFDVSDRVAELNGTMNGQQGGALTIEVPKASNNAIYEGDLTSYETVEEVPTYSVSITKYKKMVKEDTFRFVPSATNEANSYIKLNTLDPVPIHGKDTNTSLPAGALEAGKCYSFILIEKKKIVEEEEVKYFAAELLGEYTTRSIKEVVTELVKHSTDISNYIIDDIGEFSGMPEGDSYCRHMNGYDYLAYREKNPQWNVLPYDLSYSAGQTIWDMLSECRDLYPNCQAYFDVYDNFCLDLIPSLENYPSELTNDFIQKIILADSGESVSYDLGSIKNVTEVFGKSYDVDFYSNNESDDYAISYSDHTYNISNKEYEDEYVSGDIIGFVVPADAEAGELFVNINGIGKIPLYDEFTTRYAKIDLIKHGNICVIKINKDSHTKEYQAYYLGEYQPHGLSVLTNDADDPYYTKKYFSEKYNVDEAYISFRVQKFSPFSVQRLGEILDVKTGGEFDNILSNSNAVLNADYYNRISSTMFDTITLTTKLIPWLDVNVKVDYKKQQEENTYSYIVKAKSDDYSSGTSSITLYKFMQLYEGS